MMSVMLSPGGHVEMVGPPMSKAVKRKELRKPMSANTPIRKAKFEIGAVVRHRIFAFRGVIFDVDPVFAHTEEWYEAIPKEVRPRKDQPFYHLLAENEEAQYVAYVSEQNLLADHSGEPVNHPQIDDYFSRDQDGGYRRRTRNLN
jgi:heat shock protein HspQ